jgi:hypothetical protein
MNKTLLVALALVALPLAGCAEDEVIDQATPETDAPVVEEYTAPALDSTGVDSTGVDGAVTEEPMPEDEAAAADIAPEAPVGM